MGATSNGGESRGCVTFCHQPWRINIPKDGVNSGACAQERDQEYFWGLTQKGEGLTQRSPSPGHPQREISVEGSVGNCQLQTPQMREQREMRTEVSGCYVIYCYLQYYLYYLFNYMMPNSRAGQVNYGFQVSLTLACPRLCLEDGRRPHLRECTKSSVLVLPYCSLG